MDIFFADSDQVPLPPKDVRILEFRANPLPDGRRVRVYLELTPFQKRPSGEVSIKDSSGNRVATVSIIETIDPKMELTIHLRIPETEGEYTVSAVLFYPEELEGEEEEIPIPPERVVVDEEETTFTITD
jgi:hypothetical protein